MSWENYGEWYIDHKIPLKYNKPSLEEVVQRLHYTNTQPMWGGTSKYVKGLLIYFWLTLTTFHFRLILDKH